MKPLPDADYLHSLFTYDRSTGSIYWRERAREQFTDVRAWCARNARYAGRVAGTISRNKHGTVLGLRVSTDSGQYLAHRVIWKMCCGAEPLHEIDHVDGNPLNNLLGNLREVSHKENLRNQKRRGTNSSGVMGVSWFKSRNLWRAVIGDDYRTRHLGYFDTFEEATTARKAAEKQYGFHQNHGRA